MVKKPKKEKKPKIRIHDKKWKSLKARGYTPPANAEENRARLKEAHGY